MKRIKKDTYEDLKVLVFDALFNSDIQMDYKRNKVDVFRMRYIEGMFDSEISKALNISESMVSQNAIEMMDSLRHSMFIPTWKYKKLITDKRNEINLLELKVISLKKKMENYRKTITAIRKELNNMNIDTNGDNGKVNVIRRHQ